MAAATSTAQSSKPGQTCRPAGSKTVANDGRSRVYSLQPLRATHSGPARLFGCILATGHFVLLGSTEQTPGEKAAPTAGGIDPKVVSLHTPWVAYSSSYSFTYDNQIWVVLRNLRTGKVKRTHEVEPTPPADPDPPPVGGQNSVTDVVVGQSGSIAWIGIQRLSDGEIRAREVAALDSSSAYTQLDTAADIDLHSLTLRGRQLSWSDDDTPHSAVLP